MGFGINEVNKQEQNKKVKGIDITISKQQIIHIIESSKCLEVAMENTGK